MTDTWTWGVDPSTVRMAMAVTDGELIRVASVGVAGPARRRLGLGMRRSLTHARLWARHYPPCAVYVEQPSGPHPNPELVYMVGAIMAGLEVALPDVPIATIPPGTWKLAALDYGAAKKTQIMEWARGQGYAGQNQDEADAMGVAVAGHRIGVPLHAQVIRGADVGERPANQG